MFFQKEESDHLLCGTTVTERVTITLMATLRLKVFFLFYKLTRERKPPRRHPVSVFNRRSLRHSIPEF